MTLFNNLFNDKEFFKSILKIAVPLVVQQLIISSLSFIDMLMIGQLGDTAVAGVGLGNQIFFLLQVLTFGVGSGASVFAAQFWGKGDRGNIRKTLGMALILTFIAGFVFTLASILFPEQILGIYSKDTAVVAVGAEYLGMLAFSFIFISTSFSYTAILRSCENVKLPFVISVIALGLKTLINYLLIFGNLGFPRMGVRGAGIATLIAMALELFCLVYFSNSLKTPAAGSIKEIFSIDLDFLKRFLKTSFPVIMSEAMWSLGMTTYNVVYARISTEAIAAINISVSLEDLGFVAFIGIANACAIMIGNRIGAGEEEKAYIYGKRFVILGISGALIIGVIIFLVSGTVVSLYNISDLARSYARTILKIYSFTLWVRVSTIILFVGILRSGGDTRYAFLLDLCAVWLIGVPLAFIGAFVLHLPVYFVYLLVFSEEAFKFVIVLKRFASKKWIHNLVQNI